MGPHWTGVRDSARDGTLRGQDEGVADVLTRWDEFSRFLSLHLGREPGADVQQVLSRADRRDMAGRRGRLTRALVDGGTLECTLRVPAAEADIDLGADLKMRAISASLYSDAPSEGRPRTRVNWLVRQLRSAPDDVRIDTYFEGRRTTSSNLLGQLAAESGTALLEDRRVVPRGFNVTLAREMGLKRGSGRGSLVESVSTLLETFYGTVRRIWKRGPPSSEATGTRGRSRARFRAGGAITPGAASRDDANTGADISLGIVPRVIRGAGLRSLPQGEGRAGGGAAEARSRSRLLARLLAFSKSGRPRNPEHPFRPLFVWSGRPDLNRRPPDPQSGALPNYATPRGGLGAARRW